MANDTQTRKDLLLLDEEDQFLSDKDLKLLRVLDEVGGEQYGQESISFQGIRRRLGLHQETLSRALRRLEVDGFLQKIGGEYRLSPKGQGLISRNGSMMISGNEESFRIPILRTILPPEWNEEELEKALAHKWFGNLRWFGSSKTEDSVVLTWTTNNGKLGLSATISSGYLLIESKADDAQNMTSAVQAAYEIFDHASKILKQSAAKNRIHQPRKSIHHAA